MWHRCWENLVLAMLGEQFMVGEEICGAVVSVRFQVRIEVELYQGIMTVKVTLIRVGGKKVPCFSVIFYATEKFVCFSLVFSLQGFCLFFCSIENYGKTWYFFTPPL